MIESIPNVSEGRRAAVVERLADAVRASGARLLDYSADPSHNRSVFTLAGDAPAVAAAMLALFDRGGGVNRSTDARRRAPANRRG